MRKVVVLALLLLALAALAGTAAANIGGIIEPYGGVRTAELPPKWVP